MKAIVVSAPVVSLGAQMVISCHSSWPLSVLFKDWVLIYTRELREAIVCNFFAQAENAIACHYCDLNFQHC